MTVFNKAKSMAIVATILLITNALTGTLTALAFTTNVAQLWLEAQARGMEPKDQDGLNKMLAEVQSE